MRKSILILSSFLLLAGCVGEENLDYDKTWNEDFDYIVDDDGTISVPSAKDITDTIDLRIFDVINLDYPGLEKVKGAYEAGKLYAETHPAEDEGTGEGEGGETGDGSGESAGESSEGDAAPESKADAVSEEGPGDKDGYYKAAAYLLEYFRTRTNVSYPQIEASLLNATYTDNEKTIADKALIGHFYVRNFEYTADDGKTYTDFPDFGMVKNKETGEWTINWGMQQPSGFPANEQEWDSQQHRHQWMLPESKVFRATGDTAYVNNWKIVYRNWVDNSPAPEGAETGNTVTGSDIRWYGLQPTERLFDQCSIFFYFLDAEEFTPGWLSFFLSEFAKTANIVMSNPYKTDGEVDYSHNIFLSQNKSLFFAGTLFPELLNSSKWKEYSSDNIVNKISTFLEDGGPKERDLHYHIGNVSNYFDISLLDNGNGNSLGNFTASLEDACNFVVDMTYPNYSVDNFNDTRSVSWTKNVLKNNNFKYYYEMFPDNNKFRYMYTERKDGSEPSELVSLYPDTGYYILRTGWTEDSAMLILKNNSDGDWHCQLDNLTFTVYSNGIKFSPDAGVYTYDNGGTRETYRSAGIHNTLVKSNGSYCSGVNFDESSRNGIFKGNFTGRNYEVAVAENANYPDLTHRRAVFLVDESFYVLVDEGYGSYSGLMKLLLKGGNPMLNDKSCRDNFVIENCHKLEGNPAVPSGDFDSSLPVTMHTNLSGNSNIMFITYPGTTDGYDANWTTGYFSDAIGERTQRRHYEICQNKPADGAVRFITVIYPYGAASEYDDLDIKAEFTDRGFSESGASVKVTVDKAGEQTIYNLSYTL